MRPQEGDRPPGAFRRRDLARLHRGAAFRVRHGDRVRPGSSLRRGDPASRSADAAGDGPHRRGEREVRDRPGRGARRGEGRLLRRRPPDRGDGSVGIFRRRPDPVPGALVHRDPHPPDRRGRHPPRGADLETRRFRGSAPDGPEDPRPRLRLRLPSSPRGGVRPRPLRGDLAFQGPARLLRGGVPGLHPDRVEQPGNVEGHRAARTGRSSFGRSRTIGGISPSSNAGSPRATRTGCSNISGARRRRGTGCCRHERENGLPRRAFRPGRQVDQPPRRDVRRSRDGGEPRPRIPPRRGYAVHGGNDARPRRADRGGSRPPSCGSRERGFAPWSSPPT